MKNIGYSRSPFAKKLGISEDFKKNYYYGLFLDKPARIENKNNNKTQIGLIRYFETKTARKKLLWIISNRLLKKLPNFSVDYSEVEISFFTLVSVCFHHTFHL